MRPWLRLSLVLLVLYGLLLWFPLKPVLRLLYPISYAPVIIQEAGRYDLDPLLIAAIIRIESSYSPEAVSPKGAQGLMQLMPETAEWAAEQTGNSLDKDALLEPEMNIRLGVWYVNHLFTQFDSIPLVLAAYNGGQGNVRQWLAEDRWDGSHANAEQIPFAETRLYVRRVMAVWQLYQAIYDDLEEDKTG